ncbi:MAG: hypothetical protein KF809_12945 [Chloroflexi bacterium]|nr:hypothetical protein [Chloroflexota bacterium]
MQVRSWRRRMSVALLAGMLAVSSVAPAAADTELRDTGKVGAHSLQDTFAQPGARCRYTGASSSTSFEGPLTAINVRAPRIRARSGTQRVGWRVIVQRKRPGQSWTTVRRTAVVTATATTGKDAKLGRQRVAVSGPSSPGPSFRVLVKMIWYRGSKVEGTARHRVDRYLVVAGSTAGLVESGSCPGYTAWVEG